jgi:uncharacterized membrane protein YqgA involved in biofilm formation
VFVGAGTVLNVATVLAGSTAGALVGQRLPQHTRDVVTDALGLVTLLVAALSAASVRDADLMSATGEGAPVLIVLGSLLVGGIVGSLLRIERRLENAGTALQRRLSRGSASTRGTAGSRGADGGHGTAGTSLADGADRLRFVEGFVTASLVFCVGPLTVLGALSDGLGRGIDQLALKSVLDGFAAIAFAASFGWGVAASALTVLVVQGAITLVGIALGDVLPDAHVAALTATGGLILVGVALRLLRIKPLPVGDLLPALLVAPLLTAVVVALR